MNEVVKKKKILGGRLGINLVCGGISHMISAGIALFLTPFLIGRLGIELYGFYPVALEIMAVAGLVMGLLNSTAGRYIAVEYARGEHEEARTYYSTVFFSALVLAAVLFLPLLAFVIFSDSFLDMPRGFASEIKLFLSLMLAAGLTDAASAVFGSSYVMTDRLDFRSAQELTVVFVKALLLWFLLSGVLPVSIVSIGVAVLVSSLVAACIRFFMARHLTPEVMPKRRAFSRAALKRVLASGSWYSVHELGGWLVAGGLLILVNVIFGAEDAGVYSIALTASRVFGGVMMMLAGIFIPTATREFARGDSKALLEDVLRGERLVGFFSLVGVSMAVGFLGDFFGVWLGGQNTPLLRLLTVMAIVPMLSIACALPFFNLAVVMNRIRKMALLYVAGALLGLALSIALAIFTDLGILGVAAVSFGVRVLWYSLFMPLYAARLLKAEPLVLVLPILRTYVGAGLSVGMILALKSVCQLGSLVSVLIAAVFSLCATLVIGFFAVYGKPKLKM